MTLALAALLTGVARAQDTSVTVQPAPVVEVVLTRAVVDRIPQDTVATIAAPAELDSLFLWTRVTGATSGTVIHHVWLHGDEEVADVALTVRGSPWRTWSKKTIPAGMTGAWRVEVRDDAGNVLQRVQFTVGSGA